MEEPTKIVNFMTSLAGMTVLVLGRVIFIYKSYIENALFLQKSSSLLLGYRQTEYIEIMTKEGSTKIVNFMTPLAGMTVLLLGRAI